MKVICDCGAKARVRCHAGNGAGIPSRSRARPATWICPGRSPPWCASSSGLRPVRWVCPYHQLRLRRPRAPAYPPRRKLLRRRRGESGLRRATDSATGAAPRDDKSFATRRAGDARCAAFPGCACESSSAACGPDFTIPVVKVGAPAPENVAPPVKSRACQFLHPCRRCRPSRLHLGAAPVVRLSHGRSSCRCRRDFGCEGRAVLPEASAGTRDRTVPRMQQADLSKVHAALRLASVHRCARRRRSCRGLTCRSSSGNGTKWSGKQWRKTVLIAKLAALLIVALLGTWFWYAWFGSTPHAAFTVRFEDEPGDVRQQRFAKAGRSCSSTARNWRGMI